MRKAGIRPKTERRTVEETIEGVKNLTSSVKKKRSKVLLGVQETFSSEMFSKKSTKKSLGKLLNLNRKAKILQKYQIRPKPYQTSLNLSQRDGIRKVQNFYHDPRISTERPEKRFSGRRLMSMSIRQVYNLFVQENSAIKISWTKFVTLRPRNIILLKKNHHMTCKCPYCQNVEFILESINRKCANIKTEAEEKILLKLTNVYVVLNVIMCKREKSQRYQDIDCINRKCICCNNIMARLKQHYMKLISMELEQGHGNIKLWK